MKRTFSCSLALAAVITAGAWAGALTLQIANPDTNAEAKSLNATLIADVTACHEPAKSKVTASYIRMTKNGIERTELQVASLKSPGKFALIGKAPAGSVIELTVTNPQFQNYEPRVLLHTNATGVDFASIKHFYGVAPTKADVKAALEAAID
jgi:hypothetical protein